jgi:hypothetical protein
MSWAQIVANGTKNLVSPPEAVAPSQGRPASLESAIGNMCLSSPSTGTHRSVSQAGQGGKGRGGVGVNSRSGQSGRGRGGCSHHADTAATSRPPCLEGVNFALNINTPIDEWLLTGKKTVETREYDLHPQVLGQRVALIRCAGKGSKNRLPQRLVGIVEFGRTNRYPSKEEWVADFERHCVPVDNMQFGWVEGRPKWGWEVTSTKRLEEELRVPQKAHFHKSFYRMIFAPSR